jgi:hypothetical protein
MNIYATYPQEEGWITVVCELLTAEPLPIAGVKHMISGRNPDSLIFGLIEQKKKKLRVVYRKKTATEMMEFDRWPLGINPEMDKHAAESGLDHWSCVSRSNNMWWMRKDGMEHQAFFEGLNHPDGYVGELKEFDAKCPLITPEEAIASNA